MMMTNFVWDEREPSFDVADGEHGVRLVKVYDGATRNGKPCTNFVLKVEGGNCTYTHSIYYGNEYTNRNWTGFLSSFGIAPPASNTDWEPYYSAWAGKEGKANFHHVDDTYTDRNGIERSVHKCELWYFVPRPKAEGQAAKASAPVVAPAVSLRQAGSFQEDIPFDIA